MDSTPETDMAAHLGCLGMEFVGRMGWLGDNLYGLADSMRFIHSNWWIPT